MLNKTESDLLYLMKCGVHKRALDKNKVNDMDMEAVYSLAKTHSIGAYIGWVLNTMKIAYPLKEEWNNTLNQAIRHRMVMDNYAKSLFKFLESKHCWYTPLKGYVLKDYYPVSATRQMGISMYYLIRHIEKACTIIF